MLLLFPLLSLISLSLPPGSTSASCPGCPQKTPVNQKIVDFTLQELEGEEGGLCKKTVISTENFQRQIVAGNLYKFDLVLKHNKESMKTCEKFSGIPESCHVEVYEIPWQNVMLLEKVHCVGNPLKQN